ncbi:hypothetical protein VTN49DRAFT_4692 [Thermomyces lanuginosus]|uniref:uncharacterized protein n=1 Tax=Thermomyces lanuginosus TaxID=5541 RepID=UPI00374405E7
MVTTRVLSRRTSVHDMHRRELTFHNATSNAMQRTSIRDQSGWCDQYRRQGSSPSFRDPSSRSITPPRPSRKQKLQIHYQQRVS